MRTGGRATIAAARAHVGCGDDEGAVESGVDGAEAGRDGPPGLWVGMGAWQMQHESADGAGDAHADLQQHEPQASDLGPRERRAVGPQLEFLQEDIRRCRQRHPELVGPEPRAAGAAHREVVMQFLEPILSPRAQ